MKLPSPLVPAPRVYTTTGSEQKRIGNGAPTYAIQPSGSPQVPEILDALGWKLEKNGEVTVIARYGTDPVLESDPLTGRFHGEGYRLTLTGEGGKFTAEIDYATHRGLRYALTTLDDSFRDSDAAGYRNTIAPAQILDGPRFPIRGIIEGYYGPPWSTDARDSLMSLMSRYKMNAYFYGPKDDAFHRRRWRDLYSGKALGELESLVARSRELDLDFWYTIGPGLSMEYSKEEDVQALLAKFDQLRGMGICRFGLLFDDIPERLQHEADKAVFSDLARAHASVGNRVFRELKECDPEVHFALCPTQYHGTGAEPYINRLGDALDPRIDIFWTGPEICSRRLDLADAADLSRRLDRPPLYWDNYPVNDCEMTRELHIGPYRGRDVHLFRASAGVVANGMEHPEASKIGLITVAAYLWNPEAYDPEEAWQRALNEVVGADEAQEFKIFADNNRYSCLNREESPDLRVALENFEFLHHQNRLDEALVVLDEIVEKLGRATALFDYGMSNIPLNQEIAPWIEKYRKGVNLLAAGSAYLRSIEETHRNRLIEAWRAYAEDRYYVFADVLDGVLDGFLADNHE